MTTSPDLRCMMKIRSCGFFWYKATVTLSFPTGNTQDPKQLGQLTISRSKVHGGDLKISLDRCGRIPTYVCASDTNNQFTVIYGDRRRCLTVRAATPAIYKAWWSALETAYMSLRLIQMKRALAANFDALPEPELELGDAFASKLDYMPMLQSMSSASQEDDECEVWQSHESPDELVIIDPTAMKSKSKHKPESTPLLTQLWPRITKSETEKNIEIDEDNSLSSEFNHWSSSDSDDSDLSSLIDSDVFDSLPKDVRDLIDDCSVPHSYSPSSNNDSTVIEPFPDDVEHLEDSPTSRITTENSSSSALSGPFSALRQRSNSDSNTASTAPLTDPSDVLLAIESDMATTKDAFTPSTFTPFARLQARIAAKYPLSNGGSVLTNSCSADRRATDSRRDRLHRSYKRQHHPRADTEARPPQNLITGRIDQVHVQEVEQFASRRLQSSTRTWKKAIVIERVTKAWTEVARFAFRPNAAGT